jgi:hypothetical protein
LARGG